MYEFFQKNKQDISFTISIKPNIYGNIAAKLAGIPKRVGLVCGLGHGFESAQNFKQHVTQFIVKCLYRIGSSCTQKYVFQNEDDQKLMIEKKIISSEKTYVIKSSGINLDIYSSDTVNHNVIQNIRTHDFKVDDNTVVIGAVARTTISKGIREFIQASEISKKWDIKVKFIWVGECNPEEPDSLTPDDMIETDTFQWIGFRNDIKEVIQSFDIMTLPSFYREGIPRSLLEGMAMRKPIVTTDNVGCRETVNNGINGYLVPIKNATLFAESVKKIACDKKILQQFGAASRKKVEQEFDVNEVNRKYFDKVFNIEYHST
jgi:N,N'-diacetylbacillosaminyl-diphospho-undecaprenol alpha-1,3-N-acetylgalactosaminyltransferase